MSTAKRKVWFITRPERDPAFHHEALSALSVATNNFTISWSGNRESHQRYEQELINIGVKRNSISNDGSGGRTWAALLKTFSYCYTDSNGMLIPTKVASEILKGNNVFENIKKQILTLQIPNAYFLESGFRPKYETSFSILPARFLIKLCTYAELSYYITKEEITFIVMTAQKDSELETIKNKILTFRKMTQEEQSAFKNSVSQYDHRERSDKGARDYYAAHSDVAHTFMLICSYTELVSYERGTSAKLFIPSTQLDSTLQELDRFDRRYPFNRKYLFSLERMAEVNGLDVNSYKASRYGDIKPATNQQKKLLKASKILSNYPNVSTLTYDEIIEILSKSAFNYNNSCQISELLLSSESSFNLDDAFVEGILNEEDNLEFENKVGRILSELGFTVVMHPKVNGERTEIDILLKYNDSFCGIIDAKNYKTKFSLSSTFTSHMASEYIPNYMNYEGNSLKFFGYITANEIGGIANLNKISSKVANALGQDIKGTMVNAKTLLSLLDYCIENDISKPDRVNLFLNLIDNNAYTSFSQIRQKIRAD